MKRITFQLLSDEEKKAIHETTLRVLEEIGIMVNHDEAREFLRKSGCIIDEPSKTVRFPRGIVEEAIGRCPSKFTSYSCDGKYDIVMTSDGTVTNYQTFGSGIRMTDYISPGVYRMRPSTARDLRNISKLVDACENVDLICPPVEPMDYAGAPNITLVQTDAILRNTSKPFLASTEPQLMEKYFQMETAVYSGDEEEARKKPFMFVGSCPSSPLQLDYHICDLAMYPEYGFPLGVLSMAMSAASAPVHLAGTMVTHNAEVLAGIVLAELVCPGRPVTYGSSTTSFDFKTNTAPVGSPEIAILGAAVAEMARFYHIPSNVAGT